MYLFEQNGEKRIKVYTLETNAERVKEYRREQLRQIKDNHIYGIKTNMNEPIIKDNKAKNSFGISEPLVFSKSDIDFSDRGLFGHYYHKMIPNLKPKNSICTDLEYALNHCDWYVKHYDDSHFSKQLIRTFEYVNGEIQFEYLLCTDLNYHKKHEFSFQKYMKDMLVITKDLYLLELLNQGHYERIVENVSEQMELFEVTNESCLNYDELKTLDKLGVSQNSWEKAVENVGNSKKILKYIKRA